MPVRLFVASQVVRFQMRRRFERAGDIGPLRPMMKRMASQVRPPPPRVRVESCDLGGVRGDWLAPPAPSPDAALLYLHGGAFMAGAPENHRALTWRLADALGVVVAAPDYRLAPEHPFPAGLEDCVAAYRSLRERGFRRIAIAGDSAGGNLTLTTALAIRDRGLPAPVALGCISPVVTLAEHLPSTDDNRDRDAMFPPGLTETVLARYAPGSDGRDPAISPLYADPRGLPPTLFQVGEPEVLRDHSVRMAERMREAGVETALEVTPRAFHVWHLAADLVPESRTAIERLVTFLRPRLAA